MKAVAEDTANVGLNSISLLRAQNESLSSLECRLDDDARIYQQSKKALRGISWYGMLYNIMINDNHHHEDIPSPKISSDEILCNNLTSVTETNNSNNQDDDIKQLGEIVDKVHNISVIMSHIIDEQNTKIDRIHKKADTVNDESLALTLRITQLRKGYISLQKYFLGKFQMKEYNSGTNILSDHYGTLFMFSDV
eukprot:gene3205-6327_t